MSKTTILLEKSTRASLRHIGRKDQTYDDLINELISFKQSSKEKVIGPANPTTVTTEVTTNLPFDNRGFKS